VRALVAKPRLLLLEEPWMNNENGYRRSIIELLGEIKNSTVVVVSNDPEFGGRCDKIITINNGVTTTVNNH
jgi:ABC-type lipoprotein export system ATPase subunit